MVMKLDFPLYRVFILHNLKVLLAPWEGKMNKLGIFCNYQILSMRYQVHPLIAAWIPMMPPKRKVQKQVYMSRAAIVHVVRTWNNAFCVSKLLRKCETTSQTSTNWMIVRYSRNFCPHIFQHFQRRSVFNASNAKKEWVFDTGTLRYCWPFNNVTKTFLSLTVILWRYTWRYYKYVITNYNHKQL